MEVTARPPSEEGSPGDPRPAIPPGNPRSATPARDDSAGTRPSTAHTVASNPAHLGPLALGTWSGGRFMRFGVPLEEDRYAGLITPDQSIRTVITADVYGEGEADRMLRRALAGRRREQTRVVGAVGHDFYEGVRDGPKGFPRFTDPRLRPASEYGDYLRMATEKSLQRCGLDAFDVLLLHNPDRTGYSSEAVWAAMAGLRDEGLTGAIGVAPGPANGFTLDLIDCLERFGELLDWAMIILNPLEPWPGELVLDAAASASVQVITRVVDYGGLFFDDVLPGHELLASDHRGFRPAGWIEAGRARLERMRPIAVRTGLTTIQLACQWNLAHSAVECVVPTLIQEAGSDARPVEDKRAELAATPTESRLTLTDLNEIRVIGDNTGCMALKGASPEHAGEAKPDRWSLDEGLVAVAQRWGIDPHRDLARLTATAG